MTDKTHSLRHAGTAIAAVLAISATPSLAQDVAAPVQPIPEPAIVLPDIPAPTAERPTIVVPPVQAETVQPIPPPSAVTTEPVAEPSRAASASRTRSAAPATVRATPEPAPRVAAATPAAVEQTAVVPSASTVEPLAAAPAAPVPVTEPAPRVANDDTGLLALVLGGLAFLALAIWGFIAIGRRKPVRRYAATAAATPAPVAPVPIVAEPAPLATSEPVAFAPRAAASAPAASLSHTAAVALPARMPESYAERDALIKRMIAAKPDRANPFTDRGARTRRARLILQSLGRDFGDAEPWIDLSQYPNNWPELARKRSAAA